MAARFAARSPPSTTTTRTAAVCSSTRCRSPTRPWPPRDTFAGIDRELALCGALLHDIGKLDAYSGDACGVSLNDAGRLIGEIPSGYYTVRRAIEQIPDFPPELAQALLHIILSHHGCLEHGSPVLPSTREALVVHAMDKLSGDLGSFDRLERETAEDETWSRFDRALGRAVLLADRDTSLQTNEPK